MKKEQFYLLGIFLAGMLGGLVRFQITRYLPSSPDFPWGTLVVNYLGIFCLVYLVKGYLVYKGSSKGTILALACGLGALVRYFFSRYNQGSVLPLGTLIANLIGCFLIGLCYNYVESKEVYSILATGFCGGLTTFSTLNDELQRLINDKKAFYSYLLLTYLLGFLAIFLGILL